MTNLNYLRLLPGSQPPEVEARPFRAAVIVEAQISDAWRELVSRWLVDSGCLYMSAWGIECSKWDDSVDYANLEDLEYGEMERGGQRNIGQIPKPRIAESNWSVWNSWNIWVLPKMFAWKINDRNP